MCVKRTKHLLKVSKIYINFELLKVSKTTSLNIYPSPVMEMLETSILGHLINIIEKVLLGTPSQMVVMSLAHNHLTILFILSYRGAAVIKFK